MVVTAQSQAAWSLPPEFDAFLFARIDEVARAAPLSVVSALARLDLDPWLEAAELTQLPKETAVHRLAALLMNLPGGPSAVADTRLIAARLICLLPAPAEPVIEWSPPAVSSSPAGVHFSLAMMFFIIITMIVAIASGLGHGSKPTPVNGAGGPAGERELPKSSPVQVQPRG